MKKYEDFVKACVDLMVLIKEPATVLKSKSDTSFYIYAKDSVIVGSFVFNMSDSENVLKAKYVGFKAMCEFLMSLKSEENNDNKTA